VGAVTASCLARDGSRVIGVDTNPDKVRQVNEGVAPIVEPQLGEILSAAVASGLLSATTDAHAAVLQSDVSLICVGTPSMGNGDARLADLEQVCRDIGSVLRKKSDYHLVIVTSTVPPGTVRSLVIPALEQASGRTVGETLGVCMSPEFMREGSAIDDFRNPTRVVIGASDRCAAEKAAEVYRGIAAPVVHTELETAEMAKLTDNAWHALKVVFANEIGRLAKGVGVDSHQLMDIFLMDTKLNISTKYMRPGFAFGGSCLPKDLRSLTYRARNLGVELPVLESVLRSNHQQVELATQLVLSKGRKRVGLLGLSFKAGTDDLRESPIVELAERLIGKGCDVRIYDRHVNLGRLVGANREFIFRTLPHIAELMVESLDELLDHAELIVAANNDPEFEAVPARLREGQAVIDLVRIGRGLSSGPSYEGISW
jgi:GDP-mannose 6-dehydrogenase